MQPFGTSLRVPLSICLAAASFAAVGRANIYNAVTDFSSSSNPNGVWSYEAAGTLFPLSDGFTGMCGGPPGIDCLYWTNGLSIPDGVSMLENISGNQLQPNSTTYVPTNYLNVDPQGLSAAVVFTAPSTGFYQVAGQFLGNDVIGNPHPVSVVENGSVTLFGGSIASYGQMDPFDFMLTLNAGDTIALDVGTGSAGCSFCFLSTGLWAEVTNSSAPIIIPAPIPAPVTIPEPTPEPQVLPLLVSAIAGLALFRLRRRAGDPC